MLSIALACLAIGCYLASTALLARHLATPAAPPAALALAWAGVLLQGGHGLAEFVRLNQLSFDFLGTVALVSWMVALLLLLAALGKPVIKLGMVVLPWTAAAQALDLLLARPQTSPPAHGLAMTVHILASIIAFGLLNIAALQALLLALQDWQLKSHPPKPLARALPSLQTMEALLFQMLAAGVLFLSVSLATGFLFIDDLFAQHLAHKTVLSLVAWVLFSGLLLGRRRYGWRGRTALLWTLSGFVSLLLAYFGSRFVLELVLHRQ